MSTQILSVSEVEIDAELEQIKTLGHLFNNVYTRENILEHLLWIKEDESKGKGLGTSKGFTSATFYKIGSQSALDELMKHLASK